MDTHRIQFVTPQSTALRSPPGPYKALSPFPAVQQSATPLPGAVLWAELFGLAGLKKGVPCNQGSLQDKGGQWQGGATELFGLPKSKVWKKLQADGARNLTHTYHKTRCDAGAAVRPADCQARWGKGAVFVGNGSAKVGCGVCRRCGCFWTGSCAKVGLQSA